MQIYRKHSQEWLLRWVTIVRWGQSVAEILFFSSVVRIWFMWMCVCEAHGAIYCCLYHKKGSETAENHEICSTRTRLGYYNATIISTLKWYQMGYLLQFHFFTKADHFNKPTCGGSVHSSKQTHPNALLFITWFIFNVLFILLLFIALVVIT